MSIHQTEPHVGLCVSKINLNEEDVIIITNLYIKNGLYIKIVVSKIIHVLKIDKVKIHI